MDANQCNRFYNNRSKSVTNIMSANALTVVAELLYTRLQSPTNSHNLFRVFKVVLFCLMHHIEIFPFQYVSEY
jgi:hypothetical protein